MPCYYFYRAVLVLVILSGSGISLFCQDSQLPISYIDTSEVQDIAVDPLHAIYLIKEDGLLLKYEMDTCMRYHNILGAITAIDVSNPFKIAVFYRDHQKVIFLDKYLGEQGSLDLSRFDAGYVRCLVWAKDDGYWMVDSDNNILFHYQTHGDIDIRSEPIYLLAKHFMPENISVDGDYVYLYNPDEGWIVYDRFAQFLSQIPRIPLAYPVIMKSSVYGISKNNFVRVTIEKDSLKSPEILQKDVQRAFPSGKEWIVLLKNDSLQLFKKENYIKRPNAQTH